MNRRALWYAVAGLTWVAVPAVALAQTGLVPCGLNNDAALSCNLCTLGQLLQNVIDFAIGLSIPIAAGLFAYAGWLYFSNRENFAQVEKAHKIFHAVFIGFCIALAGWLIVQTVLKALAPGYRSWKSFQCNNADRPMDATIGQLLDQVGLGQIQTPVSVAPTPQVAVGPQVGPQSPVCDTCGLDSGAGSDAIAA